MTRQVVPKRFLFGTCVYVHGHGYPVALTKSVRSSTTHEETSKLHHSSRQHVHNDGAFAGQLLLVWLSNLRKIKLLFDSG